MENKVVVHMRDGTIHKGVTQDFSPDEELFHLLPGEGGGFPIRLRLDELKALFYVKDYIGNRDFVARRKFAEAHESAKRAIVAFNDGEEVWGILGEGADEDSTGFFFYPADKEDNNIRIFVIRSAMKELRRIS